MGWTPPLDDSLPVYPTTATQEGWDRFCDDDGPSTSTPKHPSLSRQSHDGARQLADAPGSDFRQLDVVPETFDAPTGAYFPLWGRAVSASHKSNGEDFTAKAAYPDFLLFCDANLLHHGALAEIKAFWTTPDDVLNEIFSAACAAPNTGRFHWKHKPNRNQKMDKWDRRGAPVGLLKQVSGPAYKTGLHVIITIRHDDRSGVKCISL